VSSPLLKFGTDGWRAVIADEFTFPNLRRIAVAAAQYIQNNPSAKGRGALIAYDRRFQSRAFAEEVARQFKAYGVEVSLSATPMPTPALSLSVSHRKAAWGIMITASHNPALYNGFKVKDGYGRSAPPEVTQGIEQRIPDHPPTTIADQTTPILFDDQRVYEKYLRSRIDWPLLKQFKASIVFDHLYGVASGIPEALLKESRLRIHTLHGQFDPLFGGLHPEPIESNLEELKKEVRRTRALVGIALDGDADRLGIVDDKGRYLTPHQVFPLLVWHCIEHKKWKGKIVQSVSLGALAERMAQAYHLPFEEVPVGFKHVAERMLREDILAGGEESGGYAVRGGLPERDGILSGLLFLEMLAARRKSPSQLVQEMEKRFGCARFKRVDMPLEKAIADKNIFVQSISNGLPARLAGEAIREVRTQDGMKIFLKSGAWVLLRPSGTEPLLRTYAESESNSKTEKLLTWAQETVRRSLAHSS
jgi:phosphomannomutase